MSRLCQSQPNPGPPKVIYHWVILFDWDLDNPEPFSIDVREHFTDCIPDSWFRSNWKPQHRQQKVNMRMYPERTMSIFCKVEKGKITFVLMLYVTFRQMDDLKIILKKSRKSEEKARKSG